MVGLGFDPEMGGDGSGFERLTVDEGALAWFVSCLMLLFALLFSFSISLTLISLRLLGFVATTGFSSIGTTRTMVYFVFLLWLLSLLSRRG